LGGLKMLEITKVSEAIKLLVSGQKKTEFGMALEYTLFNFKKGGI
jgi:hypothetical protein